MTILATVDGRRSRNDVGQFSHTNVQFDAREAGSICDCINLFVCLFILFVARDERYFVAY